MVCLWNYSLKIVGLLISLKNPVSEHLWTVNILTIPKQCLKLHSSIFVTFFDLSERKSVQFNATNSNAIISKSKNTSWFFFWISSIYIKYWILWNQGWASKVFFFWNYRLQIAVLLKCVKSCVYEHLWTVNMLKGRKHWLKLRSIIFVEFP